MSDLPFLSEWPPSLLSAPCTLSPPPTTLLPLLPSFPSHRLKHYPFLSDPFSSSPPKPLSPPPAISPPQLQPFLAYVRCGLYSLPSKHLRVSSSEYFSNLNKKKINKNKLNWMEIRINHGDIQLLTKATGYCTEFWFSYQCNYYRAQQINEE